jgi:hypothetical protein
MASAKAKTAILALAAAVVILSGATVTLLVREIRSRKGPLFQEKSVAAAAFGGWNLDINSQTLAQMPPLLLLRPTKLPANWVPADGFGHNRYFARGKTVKQLLAAIYSQRDSAAQLIFLAPLPDDKLDCIVTPQGQTKWWEALESEINTRFNLVTHYERREGEAAYIITKAQ